MDEKEINFYKERADYYAAKSREFAKQSEAFYKAWTSGKPNSKCLSAYHNQLGMQPKGRQ